MNCFFFMSSVPSFSDFRALIAGFSLSSTGLLLMSSKFSSFAYIAVDF